MDEEGVGGITLHPSTHSSSIAKRITQSVYNYQTQWRRTVWYTVPVKESYLIIIAIVFPTSNVLSGVKHAYILVSHLLSTYGG